ncbi:MAG: rhomboid family intramembrane serine protease [Kangiellaceae bacterium]|jgi:membrane associated rhomboid family serine protease|nr:rhomboid family intramembrane serine protease [Kangiellaceae bacterium]
MLLIIPTEVSLDKKQLPWLTIALILCCILTFLTLQLNDGQRELEVFEFYERSELFHKEQPYFEQYLETPQALRDYHNVSKIDVTGPERLNYIIFDENFREFLRQKYNEYPSTLDQQWYWLAESLQDKKQKLVTHQWGIRSDNINITTLFSHLFLHADLGHLLGNMIFLFVFGLGVERLFGMVKFLTIYLAAGLIGGITFSLLDGKPFIPLVGASGAISGLMGAYVAYYGLKKISFFAWFGFYFNHFKWPALAVLLYWIAKELFYQMTDQESNVAYIAHSSGLFVGAILGFFLIPDKSSDNKSNRPVVESENYLKTYEEALVHIRKLDVKNAKVKLHQVISANPHHLNAYKSLFHLEKANPANSTFTLVVDKILQIELDQYDADTFILDVIQFSFPEKINIEELSITAFFNMIHRLLRNDRVQAGEPLINKAKKVYAENEQLPSLLYQWSMALLSRGKSRAAAKEFNYLINYYGESRVGQMAIQQLKDIAKENTDS